MSNAKPTTAMVQISHCVVVRRGADGLGGMGLVTRGRVIEFTSDSSEALRSSDSPTRASFAWPASLASCSKQQVHEMASNSIASFDFQARTRVISGRGASSQVGRLAREIGFRRALLVADPGMIGAGYLSQA